MTTLGMVTVVVDDYDRAIDFYVRVLGFSLVEDSPMGPDKRWVVISPGGTGARLLIAKATGPEQRAAIGNSTGGRVGFFLYTEVFDETPSANSVGREVRQLSHVAPILMV